MRRRVYAESEDKTMSAIALVARADLRRRWFATVAVAVLVGVVGAVVLSSLSGARRSNSALRRFNEYSRSGNLEVTPGRASPAQIAEFRRTPGIAALGVLRIYAVRPTNSLPFLAMGRWHCAPNDPRLRERVRVRQSV
jgi:hypothetical protein